ncbi:hypothetical protein P691DRAFT_819052, partial [Macrolepiota fuliginosa MF-IS2]
IPDYFPKIFGKSEKELLDIDASGVLFEKIAEEINASHKGTLSLDKIVYGTSARLFFLVFDEKNTNVVMQRTYQSFQRDYAQAHMCVCALTEARRHNLACLSNRQSSGIKTILIHRCSSILSAYGLALANR